MPASTAETPAVALSFANNFWGKDDAGVSPLINRMAGAKQTCDELRAFYGARASIEEEYARKLMNLCKKSLGSQEIASLKISLDTVRGEVEQMAKQHQNIAAEMRSELEEPLAAFAGGMKERRKIVQNTVEKLLKVKMQQTQHVNKTRDKYEQECLKIKGYLAQGHMVMGQEERRNKAKLEKTQISLATSNTEYENAVKALEETTARWNREWKAAADKFQDLEEERLDFTKGSLWAFANISSTVCVSDDASCEKIRLSLEKMYVDKDIITFITDRGTGQEIPDAPKYINFCRGDINDSQSETSEDDNYSVAQFPRNINPAFRSSSPQPSTFESHHDPDSALAKNLAHREPGPPRREVVAPRKPIQPAPVEEFQQPPPPQPLQQPPQQPHQVPQSLAPQMHQQQQLQKPPQQRYYQMQQQMIQPRPQPNRQSLEMRRSTDDQYHRPPPGGPGRGGYDVHQHGPVATVPHDPYPMDGMTMLCRPGPAGPPSDRSSQITSGRPSSRDSHSDYSNPTSFSSLEPPSGKVSPVKQEPAPAPAPAPITAPLPITAPAPLTAPAPVSDSPSPTKLVAKKKSGFLKNHSPFRRKSQREIGSSAQNRNTWHAASARNGESPARRPQLFNNPEPQSITQERTQSPEPIEADASLALGIGQNVFPVSNPDEKKRPGATPAKEPEETDPIALALAELKGVTLGKQSSVRMSADHYHGIPTPAPGSEANLSRSVPVPGNHERVAVKRGTPPPSYVPQSQVSRLGVPPPAVTSKAMKEATKKATNQTRSMFESGRPGSTVYGAASSGPAVRTEMGRERESGNYTAPPVSRSGTRATEMNRADTGGYTAPPMSRSGTRATDIASPITRPGTRGSDMSRGGSGVYGTSPVSRPGTRGGTDLPRATSPAPIRSASPQPPTDSSSRMSHRSASPNPYQRSPSQMSSPQKRGSTDAYQRPASQMSSAHKRGSDQYFQQPSPQDHSRAPSPVAYRDYNRPQSSYGGNNMAVQLADDPYGSQRSRGSRPSSRATNMHDGGSRQRSKSVADPSRLYTPDGRPILHYARALYMYQAAIPEELGFNKNDYLAVLRHQDDGWWEAEVHDGNGRIGLVPSNYLQPC